jgi:hypothetical protein
LSAGRLARQFVARFDALGQAGQPVELAAQRRRVRHMAQRLALSRQVVELGDHLVQRRAAFAALVAQPPALGEQTAGPGDRGVGRAAGEQGVAVRQPQPAGVLVELLVQRGQFAFALGQVLGRLDDGGALVGQPLHGVGLGQQRVVDAEGLELRARASAISWSRRWISSAMVRRASSAVRQRAGKSAATSGRVPEVFARGSNSSMRRRRGSAFFSRPSREASSRSLRCSCRSWLTLRPPRRVRCGPGARCRRAGFPGAPACAPRRMALAGLPERARGHLAAGRKQLLGLGRQLRAQRDQRRQARRRGQQGFADPAAAVDEPPGAGAQPLAIEPEGIEEQRAVDAAEETRQRVLGQRRLGIVEQRVLVALAAPEPEALAVLADDRGAEAHVGIAVQEIERAARLDAVEHVGDCGERGRLAGLVGAVDDGEGRIGAKRDAPVGEAAEAVEMQLQQPHGSPSPWARRRGATR